ncbi:MAG TPA: hypothetical protein VFN67_38115 [Polyangiales bacterium]|nr:hypothetical protein [Polyangiales bacterium]
MSRTLSVAIAALSFSLLGCGSDKTAPSASDPAAAVGMAPDTMTAPLAESARPGVAGDGSTTGQTAAAQVAAGRSSQSATAGNLAASTAANPAPAGQSAAAAGQSAAAAGQTAAGGGAGTDQPIDVQPAPADVSTWEQRGTFDATSEANAGPGRAYTMFRPSELGKDGFKHPIVTWGNGSGTTPSTYTELLTHWATHGFVVVASNATDTGSGEEMIAGVDWLIAENERADSVYFGKLDVSSVGAIGYSQGGIGTVIAAVDPRVTTSVPIAGGDSKVDQVHGPIFLIGFVSDTTVPPLWNMAPQYEAAHVPAVYGVLQGGSTHFEALGDGGRFRGYTTAWLVFQLLHDNALSGVFFGKDCTLCKDSLWVVERKNVPGVDPPPTPSKDECLASAPFPGSASAECKNCLCESCPRQTVECSEVCWELATCMVKECSNNADKDIAHFACTGITANAVCGEHADGIRFTTAMSGHAAGCMAPGKCLELCIK